MDLWAHPASLDLLVSLAARGLVGRQAPPLQVRAALHTAPAQPPRQGPRVQQEGVGGSLMSLSKFSTVGLITLYAREMTAILAQC